MPSGRRKEFIEEDVLERASARFAAYGFGGTTLAHLEDSMGIGRQSIYETFGDKRSLFKTCLERYRIRVIKPLLQQIRDIPEIERIPAIVFEAAQQSALEDASLSGLLVGSLVELQCVEPELARIADQILDSIREELECRFTASRRSLQLPSESKPENLAAFLVASFVGVLAMARGERSNRWVTASIHQIVASFRELSGLPKSFSGRPSNPV